jgi:hypothetical protein
LTHLGQDQQHFLSNAYKHGYRRTALEVTGL